MERSIDWRLVLAAPYAPTPEDTVSTALKLASLKKGELLYDLGCGDGRILIAAARDFGAKAIGFEIQHELVEEAKTRINLAGLDDMAMVLERDFFNESLSEADMIFIYLTPSMLLPLAEKLRKELRRGSRVVDYKYPIKGWIPCTSSCDSSGNDLFLYGLSESAFHSRSHPPI